MQGLFAVRPNPNAEEELMKKMKKRRKKEKKRKEGIEFTLVSSRRKVKRPPSDVAIAVNELIKKGYDTNEKIAGYFETQKSKTLSNAAKNMYFALVNSKVYADNVRLTDNITNRPLHCYYFIKSFKTKTLSNDELWLNLLNKKSYSNLDAKVKELYDISEVASAWFGSNVYEYNNEKILKGYYQDFTEDFALIGANGLDDQAKYNLLNENTFQFTFKGVSFKASGNTNTCVIYNTNLSAEAIKSKIKNTVMISSTESGFSLNEKKIELKQEVFKYVDTKVKPEVFCPAFLIMPNEKDYSVVIKMDIDYNKLFLLFDKYVEKRDIKIYDNLFYWETMDAFFDFLAIYIVTTKVNAVGEKKVLKGYYDTYMKYKPVIDLWKNNQIKYGKILYTFYYAFAGKINYDKLTFLEQRVNEYIVDRNSLMKEENYAVIYNFFKTCPYCSMIANQFDSAVFGIADAMREAIVNLKTGGQSIVETLKKIGICIYKVSMSAIGTEGSKVSFPFGVAFGTFLGNLWYKDKDGAGILAINAQRVQSNIIARENDEEMKADEDLDMMSNAEKLVDDKILGFIASKESAQNFKLNDNDKKDVFIEVKNILKSTGDLDKIKKTAYKSIKNNKQMTSPKFPKDAINKIVNLIKQRKNEKNKEILDAQNKVNDFQMGLDQAQKELDNIDEQGLGSEEMEAEDEYDETAKLSKTQNQPLIQPIFGSEPGSIQASSIQSIPSINVNIPKMTPADLLENYWKSSQINPQQLGSSYAQFLGDIVYLSGLYPEFEKGTGTYVNFQSLKDRYNPSKDLINAVVKLYKLNTSDLPNYKSKGINRANVVFDEKTISTINSTENPSLLTLAKAQQGPMFNVTKVQQ